MDALWTIILSGINHLQAGMYQLIRPMHALGPAFTIAVLAVVTILFVRFFTRRFKTRRYRALEQEFNYWFSIKQEALKLREAEPEKAKQMGINIDKGKLNEVYYNYFFEGLLNNLLTTYIPIFSMLAFVNYTYQPEALKALFGKSSLFILVWVNGQTYPIGSVFWFVFCVFAAYLAFFILGRIYRRYRRRGGGRASLAGCEA